MIAASQLQRLREANKCWATLPSEPTTPNNTLKDGDFFNHHPTAANIFDQIQIDPTFHQTSFPTMLGDQTWWPNDPTFEPTCEKSREKSMLGEMFGEMMARLAGVPGTQADGGKTIFKKLHQISVPD